MRRACFFPLLLKKGFGQSISLTTTVEGHAASAGKVMLLETLFVDGLLGNNVAGAEEDGGSDGLCEEGPSGQSGLVPERCVHDLEFFSVLGLRRYLPPEHFEVDCGNSVKGVGRVVKEVVTSGSLIKVTEVGLQRVNGCK